MRNAARIAMTAALLTLGVAGSLSAQGRYEDRNHRYDRGRDGRPYNNERAAVLAHEIEQLADRMHGQFERNNRRPDNAEFRLMETLHELENRANRFHGAIEREPGMPRNVRNEFDLFEKAFARTARALNQVRPRGYLDRGMERIYGLMNELERYFGSGRGYGRWRDHDRRGGWNPRYDARWDRNDDRHDRYDRRDHDDDRWDRRREHERH